MYIESLGKIIPDTAITGVPTSPAVNVASAPIVLRPIPMVAANGVYFFTPGASVTKDVYGIEAIAKFTQKGGTSPTGLLKLQGCNSLSEVKTTLTASMTTGTTTATVAALDSVGPNTYILVYRADGTGYEWMLQTAAASTGAGNFTVTRAQFGTTAITFSSGDYVFYTNSWTDIPSNNSTTTTLTSGATSINTAAGLATPVTVTVSSQALGMTSIDYPIVRAVIVLGGTSPVSNVEVSATLKVRAQSGNLQ